MVRMLMEIKELHRKINDYENSLEVVGKSSQLNKLNNELKISDKELKKTSATWRREQESGRV